MSKKFLDSDGLLYVWSKIKTALSGKVDAVQGKQLSTNDFTDAEKQKLASLSEDGYTLSPATSNSLGGIIVGNNLSISAEGILSANANDYGEATSSSSGLMSSSDKSKLDAFSAASSYALKSDIVSAYIYKGSVATTSQLPANANNGDVYNVEADGMNYAWTGLAWDALGGSFGVDTVTNADIDAIFAT